MRSIHPKLVTTGLLHLLFRAWLIPGPCHILLMSSNSVLCPLLSYALSFVMETMGPLSDPWKAYFQVHSLLFFFYSFDVYFCMSKLLKNFQGLFQRERCLALVCLGWDVAVLRSWEVREDPSSLMKTVETTWCLTEDDDFLCRPLMGPWYGLKDETIP